MLVPPVLFLLFKRPDTTRRTFEAIRRAAPRELMIVADGARPDRPDEAALCGKVREIVRDIDWECNCTKIFRETNLGCRDGIVEAMDGFFERYESGIILEDDCLPHPDFFRFAAEILEMFKDDERIMMIGGMNQLGSWKAANQGFHFSQLFHTWGWATWRRAWAKFDVRMCAWDSPECRARVRDVLADDAHFAMCKERFDLAQSGVVTAWDYQWFFALLLNAGLTVVPSVNLVTNIGFGEDATNTVQRKNPLANMKSHDYSFPIAAPPFVAVDREYDRLAFRDRFGSFPAWWVKSKIKAILRLFGNGPYEAAKRAYHRFNDGKGDTRDNRNP